VVVTTGTTPVDKPSSPNEPESAPS
jgi:hypothetical protein